MNGLRNLPLPHTFYIQVADVCATRGHSQEALLLLDNKETALGYGNNHKNIASLAVMLLFHSYSFLSIIKLRGLHYYQQSLSR